LINIYDEYKENLEAIKEINDDNLEIELDKQCERYTNFTKNNHAEHMQLHK
jgi:hypothetical protein